MGEYGDAFDATVRELMNAATANATFPAPAVPVMNGRALPPWQQRKHVERSRLRARARAEMLATSRREVKVRAAAFDSLQDVIDADPGVRLLRWRELVDRLTYRAMLEAELDG